GSLAISKIFAELHKSDERQAPGREARLAIQREAGGKGVVLEDRAQGIPQEQVGIAFGKGGTGHPGGFVRYRRDDVRGERHGRRPLIDGVKARQQARSVLCHNPLPRDTPWGRKSPGALLGGGSSLGVFFTTEMVFVVNREKKPFVRPIPKARTSPSFSRRKYSP